METGATLITGSFIIVDVIPSCCHWNYCHGDDVKDTPDVVTVQETVDVKETTCIVMSCVVKVTVIYDSYCSQLTSK